MSVLVRQRNVKKVRARQKTVLVGWAVERGVQRYRCRCPVGRSTNRQAGPSRNYRSREAVGQVDRRSVKERRARYVKSVWCVEHRATANERSKWRSSNKDRREGGKEGEDGEVASTAHGRISVV